MEPRNLPPELSTRIIESLSVNDFFYTDIHLINRLFSDISIGVLQKKFNFFSPANKNIPVNKKHIHAAAHLYQTILQCKRPDQANRLYAKLYEGISLHPDESSFQFYFGLILCNENSLQRNINGGVEYLIKSITCGDERAAPMLLQLSGKNNKVTKFIAENRELFAKFNQQQITEVEALKKRWREDDLDDTEFNNLTKLLFNANDSEGTHQLYEDHKENFTDDMQKEFKQAFFNGNIEAAKMMSKHVRQFILGKAPVLTLSNLWWVQLAADIGDKNSFQFLIDKKHHCALTLLYLYGFDTGQALSHFSQIQPEQWDIYLNNGIKQGFITGVVKKDINGRIARLRLDVRNARGLKL